MKYKVGDKVRVRKDLKTGERYYSADKQYDDGIVHEMLKMAGKIVTIKGCYKNHCYTIEEFGWNWTDEMFEDVPTFKIGDRVRVNGDRFRPDVIGEIGTVRKINESGKSVGVEFDKNINGNSLSGNCEDGYGWNVDIENLELIEESPKFKLGDRVRVLAPTDGKTIIVGRIGTIIGFVKSCNQASIEFDENINGHDCSICGNSCKDYYGWNCDMDTLELVTYSKDSKIVITTDGKTTTAKLYDGKKFVKSAEAKCSPDDKFDFERGAIIAFSRLTDCDYKLADEAEEPTFTKDDLKTGMFVLTDMHGWAVIVDDKLIYENGTYDRVSDLSDDLCFYHNKIEAVVEARSFGSAKLNVKYDENVLYRRSDK